MRTTVMHAQKVPGFTVRKLNSELEVSSRYSMMVLYPAYQPFALTDVISFKNHTYTAMDLFYNLSHRVIHGGSEVVANFMIYIALLVSCIHNNPIMVLKLSSLVYGIPCRSGNLQHLFPPPG